MNINFATKFFKVRKINGKDFSVFKALDLNNCEGYNFFVDNATAEKIEAYEGTINVSGYNAKKGDVYKDYLTNVTTSEGDIIYQFKK